jgi:hypothetical protein
VAYVNYKRKAATIQNSGGVSSQTFTVTIASPAVITSNTHGLILHDTVIFTTTGALPTGLAINTVYYVISAGLTANAFQVSATRAGSAINTSGTQSGTHTFTVTTTNPKWGCQSPAGRVYFADDNRHVYQQTAVNGSTFKHLTGNNILQDIGGLAFWNNYLLTMGEGSGANGQIEICGNGSGDSAVTSANWNNSMSQNIFTVTIASPAVFTAASHGFKVGDRIKLATSGALPTGLDTTTFYYVISAGLTNSNFELSTTSGGAAVNTSGTQSGFHSYTLYKGQWPIISGASLTFSSAPSTGDITATGFSYNDGTTTVPFWNQPSGFYSIEFVQEGYRQIVLANFTQGSNVVSWTPALNSRATTAAVTILTNSNASDVGDVQHMSLIAKNTADLYWCNGPYIAALTQNVNQKFDKNNPDTFTFYSNILALPTTETATWLMELRNALVILGKYVMYSWDFVSSAWSNPVPIDEILIKGINILNTLYVFAGNKGNIYLSNGYSFERYAKLPDYIAGVIDPAWRIGGVMQHRQKLFFQAIAYNSATGTAIFAGTFSLNLNTKALVMEAQNSGGLAPTGINSNGLLIDNSNTDINYDNYYSAYGATNSKMDYNDTTLFSNDECIIETDAIPIGTFLQPTSSNNMEFKLDRPLAAGDSIKLYARTSLADAYTLVGTTTTAVLSNVHSPNWEKAQWVQFQIVVSTGGSATVSSFVRLREIRLR